VLHRFGFSVTPEESGEMIKFADGKTSGLKRERVLY